MANEISNDVAQSMGPEDEQIEELDIPLDVPYHGQFPQMPGHFQQTMVPYQPFDIQAYRQAIFDSMVYESLSYTPMNGFGPIGRRHTMERRLLTSI